jgi:hypothetical protein
VWQHRAKERKMKKRIRCACPECDEVFIAGPGDVEAQLRDADWEVVEMDWYCPTCIDYSVDPESGEVLCGGHSIPDIEWGPIMTGRSPGSPSYQIGRDASGRRWITKEWGRGEWTVPAPIEEEDEYYDDE